MDQPVPARRRRCDVDVLPLEVGGVLIAVPHRDPGEETAEAGLAEPTRVALAREWPEPRKRARPRRPVTVTEAEPRLPIASHHSAAAADATQLVLREAQQVPVPVVRMHDIPHRPDPANELGAPVLPTHELIDLHLLLPPVGTEAVKRQRARPMVLGAGHEAESQALLPADEYPLDLEIAGHDLVEVGKERRRLRPCTWGSRKEAGRSRCEKKSFHD